MKTYQIAFLIFIVVAIWMLSGVLASPSDNAGATQPVTPSAKTATAVRVQTIKAKPKQINIRLQGHTQAKRVVDVTAQINGTVIKTPVEKGQRVKKGDLLCQLAKEDRPAQVLKAKASVEQAQFDYDGSQKLFDRKLISSSDLASKKAILKSQLASLEIAELNLKRLNIRAPFDGFVEMRPAEIGSMMQAGNVCARLIDESIILATAQSTQKDVQHLSLGQPVSVHLVGGRNIAGKISFIGREANPATRTYHVEARINNTKPVRDGISAQLVIPIQQVNAHHIPTSVLALNDAGELGVRLVNNEQKVLFAPIQVVDEDPQGAWVTGLANTVDLIVVGQEMVNPGDKVTVTYIGLQE